MCLRLAINLIATEDIHNGAKVLLFSRIALFYKLLLGVTAAVLRKLENGITVNFNGDERFFSGIFHLTFSFFARKFSPLPFGEIRV